LTGNGIDDGIFHTLMLCVHHHPSLLSLSFAMNHLSGNICSSLTEEEQQEEKYGKQYGEFWIFGSTVFENMDTFNEFREEYYSLLLGEEIGVALVEKLPTLESRKGKKPPSLTKEEELCTAWELEMAKQQPDGGAIEVRGNEKIVSINLSSNALFCWTNWKDAIASMKHTILEKKQLRRVVLERNIQPSPSMDPGDRMEMPVEDENDVEDRLDAVTSYTDEIDTLLSQRASETEKPQENA
jgi:hypothetical protein